MQEIALQNLSYNNNNNNKYKTFPYKNLSKLGCLDLDLMTYKVQKCHHLVLNLINTYKKSKFGASTRLQGCSLMSVGLRIF